eukprot:112237_1
MEQISWPNWFRGDQNIFLSKVELITMKRSLVPMLDDLDEPLDTNSSKRRKINDDESDDDIAMKRRSRKKKTKTKIANCSICLEYMNSSGNHQICCLKCGHIFGRRCIEHTLRKNGLCPICKKTARVNDIRNLFNANISVRDIGDRDIWENKYHLAMNKLQHQLMRTQSFQTKLNKLKNTNNNLQQTNKTLKLELLKMKSQYHNEQNQRIELLTQDTNIILDQFKFNTNTNRKQNDLNNQNIKLQTNVNILNNKNNIMNRIGEPITA